MILLLWEKRNESFMEWVRNFIITILFELGYLVFNFSNCTMILSNEIDIKPLTYLIQIKSFDFKIKSSHSLFDKTFLNLRSNKPVNQKRRVKRFWHFAPETRPSTALHAHEPWPLVLSLTSHYSLSPLDVYKK